MTSLAEQAGRGRVAALDDKVDALVDRMRGHPVADRIFYSASALGDFSLIWLWLACLRGLRSEEHARATSGIGIVIGLESLLVNVGVKSLFKRTRPPWQLDRPRPLRQPRSSSFPSGHATSGFCAAVLLADQDPLWPLYFLLAAVVASSRVYVKIHHASDVVAGIPLGLALGALARKILRPASAHPRHDPGEMATP